MVVSLPMWPPASMPSTTTALAPMRSIRLAKATDATTGIRLMPASSKRCMYLLGLPAPVVMILTPDAIK